MKCLPEHVECYKRTKTFTHETVPKGLLNSHSTMEGVWGKIVVLEGRLEYTIEQPHEQQEVITPDRAGIIEPRIFHHIRPLGTIKFYLEFYR